MHSSLNSIDMALFNPLKIKRLLLFCALFCTPVLYKIMDKQLHFWVELQITSQYFNQINYDEKRL